MSEGMKVIEKIARWMNWWMEGLVHECLDNGEWKNE